MRNHPHRCYYCKCSLSDVAFSPYQKTMDHKIPLSRGGRSHSSNMVPCCRRCNEEKAGMTASEYKKKIRQNETSCF